MKIKLKIILAYFFIFFICFSLLNAQNKKNTKPQPKLQKSKYPLIKTIVKNCQKLEGFLTLFYNKKEEKLFALIKKSQLNKNFIIALSISGGPIFRGWQWRDMLVRWEKRGDYLLLVKPNIKHRCSKPTIISSVVKDTYTPSVIHILKILSIEGENILVDFSQLLKKDICEVGRTFSFFLGGSYILNQQISSWRKVKVFPQNVEIEVEANFMGSFRKRVSFLGDIEEPTADKRGFRIYLHYSLADLPNTGYKPRRADDRVGYFITTYKDYSTPITNKTQWVRYINRWQLEKADSTLKLSPPKKPIVFYIEKTVPIKFRYAVKQGILEWNKAFKKIGILDAIEVRQQTESEFNNLEPEDMRYNFFRWITSGIPYAMGPSRVNPLTGQILDADIVFDDSFTRYYFKKFNLLGPESITSVIDNETLSLLKDLPSWKRIFNKKVALYIKKIQDYEKIFNTPNWKARWGKLKNFKCECAQGMSYQVALGYLYLLTMNKDKDEYNQFLQDVVKEVVTHEIGHTLGLRHNFKGSSWLKLSQINNGKNSPKIISASIMDYNPINFWYDEKKQGVYQTMGIGPYDYWAIEYGYSFPEKGENEDRLLNRILSKVAQHGLEYATDEDSSLSQPDPLAVRWDLGDDLVCFAKSRFKLLKKIQKNLLDKVVKKGESFYYARKAFDFMLFQYLYTSVITSRYIGGEYFFRDHKGDKNGRPPFIVVEAKKQRESLEFLCNNLFAETSFKFTPEFLNHLAPQRWTYDFKTNIHNPIHLKILVVQSITLNFLLSPFVITRLHDEELQVPINKDAFTVAELIDKLTNSIFSELYKKDINPKYTLRNSFINSFRRNLQQEYINILIDILNSYSYPSDIKSLILLKLEELYDKINTIIKNFKNIDLYTKAHLYKIRKNIKDILYKKEEK